MPACIWRRRQIARCLNFSYCVLVSEPPSGIFYLFSVRIHTDVGKWGAQGACLAYSLPTRPYSTCSMDLGCWVIGYSVSSIILDWGFRLSFLPPPSAYFVVSGCELISGPVLQITFGPCRSVRCWLIAVLVADFHLEPKLYAAVFVLSRIFHGSCSFYSFQSM